MSAGILVDVGQSPVSFKSEFISIDMDVELEESHEWSNEVTFNPVELGSQVTDHIQEQPDKLKITGFISDSSISESAIRQLNNIDGGQFETRVQTAFDLLLAIKRERKLVTVYTRYKIYAEMAITSITIPRDYGSGDSMEFSADFINVRLVSTKDVDVPAGISKKQEKKEGGKNGSVAKKTSVQSKSGEKTTVSQTKESTVTSKTTSTTPAGKTTQVTTQVPATKQAEVKVDLLRSIVNSGAKLIAGIAP